MPFDLATLILAPLIVLLAYVVLAVGGFGSALVSIPLLALLLPVKVVLPVVLIVDFIATFLTGLRLRRDIALDEVKPLIPFTLIGLIAGVTLLVKLPARWVLTALGIFILAYSLYSLIHHDRKHIHSRWWALPTGLSGGLFGGMFGMGGPIYVMHLSGRIPDAARLRATLSTVFTINTAARLALFFASGLLLQHEVWLGALCLLPFMALGLFAGHHVDVKLTRIQVARFISLLLLATGASIVFKAWYVW